MTQIATFFLKRFCLLVLALTWGLASKAGESQIVPSGKVIAWGFNNYGAAIVPVDLTNAIQVSAGEEFSLALVEGGVVRSLPSYAKISENTLSRARAVAAGNQFAIAIRPDKRLNVSGYADVDYFADRFFITPSNVVSIAAGGYYSLAVLANGRVLHSGGRLAVLDYPSDFTLPGVSNIVMAAVNGWFLLLNKDGRIQSVNSGADALLPPLSGPFKSIASGAVHALALRENGTVVAWGGNNYGQTNVPPGLTNVVAIAAGAYFSMALTGDGTIVFWGEHGDGEDQIPPHGFVSAIAAGPHYAMAIVGPPSPVYLPALKILDRKGSLELSTDLPLNGVIGVQSSHDLGGWLDIDKVALVGDPLNFIYTNSGDEHSVFFRLKKP